MHVIIFLCLGGLLASAAALPSIADDIKMMENFDAEPVLNDPSKWKVFYNCYMDLGPCGELQGVRDATIRLYINKCEKCSEKQKKQFYGVIAKALEMYPEECGAILNKYSPKTE